MRGLLSNEYRALDPPLPTEGFATVAFTAEGRRTEHAHITPLGPKARQRRSRWGPLRRVWGFWYRGKWFEWEDLRMSGRLTLSLMASVLVGLCWLA
jgi:hypothetical protein